MQSRKEPQMFSNATGHASEALLKIGHHCKGTERQSCTLSEYFEGIQGLDSHSKYRTHSTGLIWPGKHQAWYTTINKTLIAEANFTGNYSWTSPSRQVA